MNSISIGKNTIVVANDNDAPLVGVDNTSQSTKFQISDLMIVNALHIDSLDIIMGSNNMDILPAIPPLALRATRELRVWSCKDTM